MVYPRGYMTPLLKQPSSQDPAVHCHRSSFTESKPQMLEGKKKKFIASREISIAVL